MQEKVHVTMKINFEKEINATNLLKKCGNGCCGDF